MKFKRDRFVHFGDYVLDRDGHARGRGRGAKLEVLWFKALWYLGNGGEGSRIRVFAERFVLGVLHETDDFDQGLELTGICRHPERLSNRVWSGEKPPRKCFIHNGNLRRSLCVIGVESAPGKKRRAQSIEVGWGDEIEVGKRRVTSRRIGRVCFNVIVPLEVADGGR